MNNERAVFGGGCFWCTEAVFQSLRGVHAVFPGYAGGTTADPTYEQVSGGTTGHAEVVAVDFDPTEISYDDLLTVFFASHDPTTLNRQGADVGTQYRSIILYTTPQQKERADAYVQRLQHDGLQVVTTVEPLETLYPAEDYHRNYYRSNERAPYCELVIEPKLKKVHDSFARLLKDKKK